MRIQSLVLVACAALLMTTGCMTEGSMAKDSYATSSAFDDSIDYRKVNRIEAQALESGHSVTWIHMPVKSYRQSRSEQVGIN